LNQPVLFKHFLMVSLTTNPKIYSSIMPLGKFSEVCFRKFCNQLITQHIEVAFITQINIESCFYHCNSFCKLAPRFL